MKNIQVFHFLLDHRVGGPHVYAGSISKWLEAEGGYSFTNVTTASGPVTDLALVNLRHLSNPLYALEIPINLLLASRLAQRAKKGGPVVFHVHGAANLAPVLAAAWTRTPLVWTFHETVPSFIPLVKLGLKALGKTPHLLSAVTAQSAELYGAPEATVMPAPVDLGFWQPSGTVGPSALKPIQILNTANLNPLKGQNFLLEALKDWDEPWVLRLVGQELETQKEYAQALKAQVAALKETHPQCSVEFLGWQDSFAVRDLLEKTDLFVLPSTSEGTPIALLEAMAMAKPCIATQVGGIPQMIPSPEQGFLVPPKDPQALGVALKAFARLGAAERNRMGQKARAQVEASYSLPKIASLFGQLYHQVLNP